MVENDVCKKCNGKCCKVIKLSMIPLSSVEFQRLKDLGKKRGWNADKASVKPFLKLYFLNLLSGCPFLENGLCSIYAQRPAFCRHFPLDFEVLVSNHTITLKPWIFTEQLPDGTNCELGLHLSKLSPEEFDAIALKEAKEFVAALKERGNSGFTFFRISGTRIEPLS